MVAAVSQPLLSMGKFRKADKWLECTLGCASRGSSKLFLLVSPANQRLPSRTPERPRPHGAVGSTGGAAAGLRPPGTGGGHGVDSRPGLSKVGNVSHVRGTESELPGADGSRRSDEEVQVQEAGW